MCTSTGEPAKKETSNLKLKLKRKKKIKKWRERKENCTDADMCGVSFHTSCMVTFNWSPQQDCDNGI